MNEVLELQFGNVETALNGLIDSISTFNPSVSSLDALMEADDELNSGIVLLAEHQANYERILTLRDMADTLDGQIKATVQLIADARKDILGLPWTQAGEPLPSVPVDDILSFAKNISKFTLPPSGPERSFEASEAVAAEGDEDPLATGQDNALATSIIPEDQKLWLDEGARRPWVPWPTEDIIRSGALADLTRRAAEGQAVSSSLEINTSIQPGNLAEADDVPYSATDLMSAVPRDEVQSAGPVKSGERPKPAAFHGFGLYNPDADET